MSKINICFFYGLVGGLGYGGFGRNFGVKGEKFKNFWGIVCWLFGYMFKCMVVIIVVFVLVIVVVIF